MRVIRARAAARRQRVMRVVQECLYANMRAARKRWRCLRAGEEERRVDVAAAARRAEVRQGNAARRNISLSVPRLRAPAPALCAGVRKMQRRRGARAPPRCCRVMPADAPPRHALRGAKDSRFLRGMLRGVFRLRDISPLPFFCFCFFCAPPSL